MTPKETRSLQTLARLGLSADRIAERLDLPLEEVEGALKRTHPWRLAEDAMFRGRSAPTEEP